MNSDIVKSEKFGHLHLVYHFTVPLKHLVNCLNANKISLNVEKTEMVIFQSKQKKFEGDLKIKLCGKIIYPTESVKYLQYLT